MAERTPSPLYESAGFWVAATGGFLIGGGVVIDHAHVARTASIWPSRAFEVGFALFLCGGILFLWSVVLFLAYRHVARHEQPSPSPQVANQDPSSPTIQGRPGSWLSPQALGSYLDQINRTMEEKGFGRNPGLDTARGTTEEAVATTRSLSWEEMNTVRVGKYEANQGLFLVHSWKPSALPDQVAEVTIRIIQHGRGPLTRSTVSGVQYTLGPNFTDHSRIITDPTTGFAIHEAMYGPMLCLAEVCFSDGSAPLILERYVDFEGGVTSPKTPAAAGPIASGSPEIEATVKLLLREGDRHRLGLIEADKQEGAPGNEADMSDWFLTSERTIQDLLGIQAATEMRSYRVSETEAFQVPDEIRAEHRTVYVKAVRRIEWLRGCLVRLGGQITEAEFRDSR